MRNLSFSSLLLILFVLGNASGMVVSGIGWWGIEQSARQIDWLRNTNIANLQHASEMTLRLSRMQSQANDILSGLQPPAFGTDRMAQDDAKIRAGIDYLKKNFKRDDNRRHIDEFAKLYALLSTSQRQAVALMATNEVEAKQLFRQHTQPLYELTLDSAEDFIPGILKSASQVYQEATQSGRRSKQMLLAAALLTGLLFTLAALLGYRFVAAREQMKILFEREQQKYRALFESSSDAILVLTAKGFIDYNPAALAMFQLPSKEALTALTPEAISAEFQADGKRSADAIKERMSFAAPHTAQRFEWLFKRQNGEVFPGEMVMGTVQLGNETVIQATIHDITLRKQNEQSLRLAAAVFESSREGIIITAPNTGHILRVNTAFTAITGYQPEEVVGQNPSILASGKQGTEFYQKLWNTLLSSGQWQGEIWNRRKNGELYPEWLSISSIRGPTGKIEYFVAIFNDITERKRAEDKIIHQAYHDALTNLPNRVLFKDRLEQSLAFALRQKHKKVAVLFIDLDRFKLVNDSLGHDAGDQLLRQFAQRLRENVRQSDTVARLGGDEFTILLPDADHVDEAMAVADKMLAALKHPFDIGGQEIFVTASIGISMFPDDGADAKTMMKNADAAMYRVKEQGRSGFQVYTDAFNLHSLRRLELENQLRKALEKNQLVLHYQPQFDLAQGNIRGVEALIRWQHPDLGMISPAEFIPLAEETGLIVPIGAWVLETACKQAYAWKQAGFPDLVMSVNLSVRQFFREDIVSLVTDAIQNYCLGAHVLELEITESVAMEDVAYTIKTLESLSSAGLCMAIDDFGTGYSSLSQLKKMPVEILKIDQSFVQDLTSNQDDAAIVNAVITMAHRLGLKVIAEGVESQAQLDHLKEQQCDFAQGYLFSRPLPANELEMLLSSLPRATAAPVGKN